MYNYRPIYILPCFLKICEKIIANRLLLFLLKYDILCDHQFGFMPGKNTTHAILSLVDYLINSFEDYKLTCGIFTCTSGRCNKQAEFTLLHFMIFH